MASNNLPLPVWIWHPDREGKPKTVLHRKFNLDKKIEAPIIGIALTGGANVTLDNTVILSLPKNAENVCRFHYAQCSKPLEIGNHHLRIEIECDKPMPKHGATSFAYNRTVGCAAWLEGGGFRLVTDDTWSADDDMAVEICKLGQEPYGDPDYPPRDFARSGFGDLSAEPILVKIVNKDNLAYKQQGSLLKLSGKIESKASIEPLAHKELVSIYHLRKQEDWKKLRKVQRQTDLNGVPKILLDLKRESNARLGIHNLSSETITILWNGAESMFELVNYEGCMTEVIQIDPGKTAFSIPNGMRYVLLHILGNMGAEFDLDVVCELVLADPGRIGSLECDDERINNIYETSVHTNCLCHQLALWDGIKRDRLPWVYDLYLAARGAYPLWSDFSILKRSLVELGQTPEGMWMNTIPDYTMWWFVSIWEYFLHRGDVEFLEEIAPAIQVHADWVGRNVDEDGLLKVNHAFTDWVPIGREESLLSLQALYVIARQALQNISNALPNLHIKFNWPKAEIPEEEFLNASPVITRVLGILAGYVSEEKAVEFLSNYELQDPITPCSAYLLSCLYVDFDMPEKGLSVIRSLWGGMLDKGATSFWEAARCSYPDDFHKHLTTFTAYGEYRMSLCHAWASTPVEWFSRVLLGVNPVSPGYRDVEIAIWAPEEMQRCSGTVSTPFGPIGISWVRDEEGRIIVKTKIPEGVRVV